jgi:hypothetical protein
MVDHVRCMGKGAHQIDKNGASASARPASKYRDADVPEGGDWGRARIRFEMDPKRHYHSQEPRKPGP